jgi:hypothetical protein
MGCDPPEVDQGLHWHDREPCPFNREQGEAWGTYVSSSMSRNDGDDMLRWAGNYAYRSRRLKFRTIRSMSDAVRKEYVPEGVQSLNFHEPLDGHQNVMFYYRDLLPCITRLLSRPNANLVPYTKFRLVKGEDGIRIIGALNTSNWYECAYVRAQEFEVGDGSPVTPLPVFCGTDVSVARKNMPAYPFFTTHGVLGDRNMSEPGSWLMVACLPHYNEKAAKAAKRKLEGAQGIRRRKVK